jgi:hypothetical protein
MIPVPFNQVLNTLQPKTNKITVWHALREVRVFCYSKIDVEHLCVSNNTILHLIHHLKKVKKKNII